MKVSVSVTEISEEEEEVLDFFVKMTNKKRVEEGNDVFEGIDEMWGYVLGEKVYAEYKVAKNKIDAQNAAKALNLDGLWENASPEEREEAARVLNKA